MNLAYELLPPFLSWAAHPLLLVILLYALYSAPWYELKSKERQNVYGAALVFLLLLWSMRAGITPGLSFHLLGATLLTLMVGWQLALLGLGLVMLGLGLNGGIDFASFSLNMLLMAVLPVALSQAVLSLSVRYLPHHFFVYVMVDAYFCSALAVAMTLGSTLLLLVGLGPYSYQQLAQEFLPFVPFMLFAEGFFTGMSVAALVLMKPEWVVTFDDRRYLAGK